MRTVGRLDCRTVGRSMLRPYVCERLDDRVRDLVERDGAASAAASVVSPLPVPGSRSPIAPPPATLPAGSSRAAERAALPHLRRADDLAPPTSTSPPTGAAKQELRRTGGRAVGAFGASVAVTPSVCIAAARRVWIAWYAARRPPNVTIGAATA